MALILLFRRTVKVFYFFLYAMVAIASSLYVFNQASDFIKKEQDKYRQEGYQKAIVQMNKINQ